MRHSIDSDHRSRAHRARSRKAAFRGPLFLFALLACAAIAAATTNAQEGSGCDPNAPAGASNACPRQLSAQQEAPQEETTPEPPPEETTPEPPPPPPKPAVPQAPAPQREVCPDGTWAPCPAPQQLQEPEEGDRPRRRRSCKKRPGVRLPKYCPRRKSRRGGGDEEGGGGKKARERRRAELEERRAERREQCERAQAGQLTPVSLLAACEQRSDFDQLYLTGRLPSRPLADPLPPGSRLDADFARLLERVAGKRWPVVLALLRAQGKNGAAPAKAAELGKLAETGGGGDERVDALADYHRAAGLAGLTRGLHAVKDQLQSRVLGSGKISLYPGGRFDVSSGSIDVRVLVTMLYLAERHGSLSVTSLISGHGVFTKSGGVSLHSYGQAMDIAAVGGTSIIGNQQPGGITEAALRSVMMLPPELHPSELISLFSMGGPSFAMADHADHIHVGF